MLACQDGRWCTGQEGCDCWSNCEVGVPVNCNDGDPCTNDTCVDDRIDPPGTGYGDGHCEHVCIPGPTCVCPECLWPSDCDDGDACTVEDCDAFGQCVYMDLNCNDGNVCTSDSCDSLLGCVNAPIPGCCNTTADCNDGILCTTDICNTATHECQNALVSGYCLIGGVCYTNGTVNPANVCESCQYLNQTDRWSGLPAGTACDDGLFCTSDSVCDGDGNCIGAGNPCNDGLQCTDDLCNEVTDSCSYTVRDTWCLIGGRCWVDYEINPANECQRCLSTTSKTAWSGVPSGTVCDDLLYCTAVDECNGLGSCVGAGNPCDDFIECTDNVCNEATDSCSYPVSAGRCYIGGVCYTNGDWNPANDCQWCESAVSRTAWTNRPLGAACSDGLFCNGAETCDGAGTCMDRVDPCIDPYACTTDICDEGTDTCSFPIDPGWCLVSSVCYAESVDNPANQCQLCQTATSNTAWTNKPNGTACNDGLFCTALDQCNGLGSCLGSGNPCDDGVACTDNTCNEATDTCSNPPSVNRCFIGGACYTNGDWNPSNNCQWCDTAVSQIAWTNRPPGADCSNGLFCDGAETCDGLGVCQDRVDPCPDGLACTDDICDEGTDTCSNPVIAGTCLIGGVCYDNLTVSPLNECQYCLSAASQTAWTDRPAGAPCDDTLYCTGVDTCDGAGTCLHPGNPCDDGNACTTNSCNEATDSCSYPINPGTCLIGGSCYITGDINTLNTCQWCDPSASQTAWTNRPPGADCDDGAFCNGTDTCDGAGVCTAGAVPCIDGVACTDDLCDEGTDTCSNPVTAGFCLVAGSCYLDGQLNAANDCQVCDTAASQTSWTNSAPGTACDDTLYCTATDLCDGFGLCTGAGNPCDDGNACTANVCNEATDSCSFPIDATACLIGGTCYGAGEINTANTCQWCDPAVSQTAWSNRPPGADCDDGAFCNGTDTCDGAGTCVAGAVPCIDGIACTDDLCDEGTDTCSNPVTAGFCLIGGGCYTDGQDNAANLCQLCDPSASQTAWTNKVSGAPCDDTLYCTGVDTCDGSGTCQHTGSPCSDGLDCTNDLCNEATDDCSFPIATGYCLIDGVCHHNGDLNPDNPCQSCDRPVSRTSWTDLPAGTSCDDGAFCNGTDTCDGGGTCVAGAVPCIDGLACTADNCNEVTNTCSNPVNAGTCLIAGACYLDGEDNPSNECQMCASATSQTAWTNKAAGTFCDDELFCTGADTCNGSGLCVGAGNPCDDVVGCTVNSCDEVSDTCSFPVDLGWCYIDGACYIDGTDRTGVFCQSCQSAVSQTSWTSKAAGTACPGDTIDCTNDICDGLGACTHPLADGWCLIGGVTCVADGTVHIINPCLSCDSDVLNTDWSFLPYGTACTADTHDCTLDICDGAGVCLHDPTPPANDTCAAPTALAPSGSGLGLVWTGSGDSFCAMDDYSGTCGGAGGLDVVYSFDVPREYAIYRYKFETAGPAPFDPLAYIQAGTAIAPSCGVYDMIVGCNDNGASSCWSGSLGYDANDVCYDSVFSGMPEGTNYLVVDSTSAAGDVHDVRISRIGEAVINEFPCPAGNVAEVQMGGTWCGSTASLTGPTFTYGNTLFCNEGYGDTAHLAQSFHINHARVPFNVTRGYVLSTEGTNTPGGFDNAIWFITGSCEAGDDAYPMGCDGWANSNHWSMASPSGWGDRLATGIIPAGKLATVDVSSYWQYGSANAYRGQYCLTVEVDTDGDGIPDTSDTSALMKGATPNLSGGDGAKIVPKLPYGDSNNSYYYPNNLRTGLAGNEVYYAYTNTVSGSVIKMDALPKMRGDYFVSGNTAFLDIGLWIYFPQAGTFCCYNKLGTRWCNEAYGVSNLWTCSSVAAGSWNSCNAWGAGYDECAYVDGAASDTYIFAVDGYKLNPTFMPSGWYSIRLYTPPTPFPP